MTSSDALTDVWEVPESLPTFAGGTYDAHVAAWRAVDVNVQKDRWTLAAIASSLIRSVGGSPRREQKRQETLIQRFIRDVGIDRQTFHRAHPVSRSQLTEGLWDSNAPRSVDGALNALVSKLRSAMRRLGVPPPHGVATDTGTYQLAMSSAWIDIESARQALDCAEGALRTGDIGSAWASANVAAAITRQPFLVGEELAWVRQQRAMLGRAWRRALLVLSSVSTRNREPELGIQYAAGCWRRTVRRGRLPGADARARRGREPGGSPVRIRQLPQAVPE